MQEAVHSLASYLFFGCFFLGAIFNLAFHNKRRGAGTPESWEQRWIRAKAALVAWPFVVIIFAVVFYFALTNQEFWDFYTPCHQYAWALGAHNDSAPPVSVLFGL